VLVVLVLFGVDEKKNKKKVKGGGGGGVGGLREPQFDFPLSVRHSCF